MSRYAASLGILAGAGLVVAGIWEIAGMGAGLLAAGLLLTTGSVLAERGRRAGP